MGAEQQRIVELLGFGVALVGSESGAVFRFPFPSFILMAVLICCREGDD